MKVFKEKCTKNTKLLSKITDTQTNFASQEQEMQKYRTNSELSVIEATTL